jgi:hypothetical protein
MIHRGEEGVGLGGQARMHQLANAAGIHKHAGFLPWHRAMLHYHERILGALIKNTSFRLPVWDWESKEGVCPPKFMTSGSAGGNSLGNTTRQWVARYAPDPARVAQKWANHLGSGFDRFAGEYFDLRWRPTDRPAPWDIEPTAADMPHKTVHNWVAGDMLKLDSAGYDPLFYMHHCGVDRLWAHRQMLRGESGVLDFVDFPRDHEVLRKDMWFFDYDEHEYAQSGRVVAKQVRRCFWEFADYTQQGYTYSFPAIRPRRILRRQELFVSSSKPQWRAFPDAQEGDRELLALIPLPDHLSGEVEIVVKTRRGLVPIGSITQADHGDHGARGKREAVNVYVQVSVPIEVLTEWRKGARVPLIWRIGKRRGTTVLLGLEQIEWERRRN